MFTWVYRETHEESRSNRKGSQWALYNATLVFTLECKGINCKQDERSNKIPLP